MTKHLSRTQLVHIGATVKAGTSPARIARDLGLPETTLRSWLRVCNLPTHSGFGRSFLTPREAEVLALRVDGLRSIQIAHRLSIAASGVRCLLAKANRKISDAMEHEPVYIADGNTSDRTKYHGSVEWSPEKTEAFCTLLRAGVKVGEAASRLKIGWNAAIGKKNRLGKAGVLHAD